MCSGSTFVLNKLTVTKKVHFKAEGSPMAYEYKLNSLFLSFSVGSAGVGRTGVFCALSLLIERLKAEGVVDVFQTVKQLRSQRPAMVQTKDQYEFIYHALGEYLDSFDAYNNFE